MGEVPLYHKKRFTFKRGRFGGESCERSKKERAGRVLPESGPPRAVHLSHHKWPGGLVN